MVTVHALTDVSVDDRTVVLRNPTITSTNFPSLDSTPAQMDQLVRTFLPSDSPVTISLDRLIASVNKVQPAPTVEVRNESVPLQVGGEVFFGEFLRNVWKDVFVGPRYQYRNLEVSLDGPQTPGGFEIPPIDIKSKSVALGVHVQRDKRDSNFYPTKGSLFNVTGDFFDQSLGSRRQYQYYKVSYNHYRAISSKQILAYRGVICSANQNVPFYDLCFYGANNDIRGYTAGEFQNRRMFATQAEFRQELPKRFGLVAFGGFGGIARRWNEFRSDHLLPAAGAGLRFTLDKKNHINYRIDWAVGREGHTLTIGIGEAF